jgi:hypothetical protein
LTLVFETAIGNTGLRDFADTDRTEPKKTGTGDSCWGYS